MTLVYTAVSTIVQAIEYLQNYFIVIQNTLLKLKLIHNADKNKLMLFTGSRNRPKIIPSVVTLDHSDHVPYLQDATESASYFRTV